MPMWTTQNGVSPHKLYHAIHCFTCGKNLPGKQALRLHRGHDVQYVDRDGRPED